MKIGLLESASKDGEGEQHKGIKEGRKKCRRKEKKAGRKE
jgi:hypothetical protein